MSDNSNETTEAQSGQSLDGVDREKTPVHPCVYCGDRCTFIADHHREEHPSKRYDPAWYMDGVVAKRVPTA